MTDTIPSPKERPILFSGPMVRAILEGRKSQTRRVVKHWEEDGDIDCYCVSTFAGYVPKWPSPHGKPGDRLWVRETFRQWDTDMCGCGENCICPPSGTPCYRATVNPKAEASIDECYTPWRPSIHMPRWASRITLEIIGIRVERLQNISMQDAQAEGVNCPVECDRPCVRCGTCADSNRTVPISHQCNPVSAFADLWDSINGKRPGCAWADNPWVWVIEFNMKETEL